MNTNIGYYNELVNFSDSSIDNGINFLKSLYYLNDIIEFLFIIDELESLLNERVIIYSIDISQIIDNIKFEFNFSNKNNKDVIINIKDDTFNIKINNKKIQMSKR
jgi:hypothetical protein